MEKKIDILHRDTFTSKKVQSTSFTYNNDILVWIDNQFLLLDKTGKFLPLNIDLKVDKMMTLLANPHMLQIKLNQH
jgi:hypothetical protein